jgi:hypothetical protein
MEDENKKPVKADYLTHYDFSGMVGSMLQREVEKYVKDLGMYNYNLKNSTHDLDKIDQQVEMDNILDLVEKSKIDEILRNCSSQFNNYFDGLRAMVILQKMCGEFVPKKREGTFPVFSEDPGGD